VSTVRHDCHAKINLFLEVLGRREDGYHEIRTVLAPIRLCDTLEAETAPAGIRLTVEGADLPADERNLAHRAARLFLDRFASGRGAVLRLAKRIPVAAGLGGGSSDAAGTLLALRDLHRPELEIEDLAPVAAELGSDVPYFLTGGLALGEGRGERVTPLGPVPRVWVALYLPGFGVSTAEVYGAWAPPADAERGDEGELVGKLRAGEPPAVWGRLLSNRLEPAAVAAEPRLGPLRATLRRPLRREEPLLLSGSGGSWFAVAGAATRAIEIAERWRRLAGGRALAVMMASPEASPEEHGEWKRRSEERS
jgi:4-diphosphocytidyl-2-C-methyl-D-erythritol kinase